MNLGSFVTSVNRKNRHNVISPHSLGGRSRWQALAVGDRDKWSILGAIRAYLHSSWWSLRWNTFTR